MEEGHERRIKPLLKFSYLKVLEPILSFTQGVEGKVKRKTKIKEMRENAIQSENDVHTMTKMVCNGNANGNEQVNEKVYTPMQTKSLTACNTVPATAHCTIFDFNSAVGVLLCKSEQFYFISIRSSSSFFQCFHVVFGAVLFSTDARFFLPFAFFVLQRS